MRALLCLLIVLLGPLLPVAAAADPEVAQHVEVEVQPDLSERIEWTLRAEGAYASAISLPPEIDITSVRDGDGDRIRYDADEESDGTELTVEGVHAEIVVRFTRPAPDATTAPLRHAGLVVAEYVDVDNDVRVSVRVPAGHRLFWISGGSVAADGSSASARADGSVHVRYAYAAPLDEGLVRVDEGIFRLYAPPEEETTLHEAARIATNATREAAALAALPPPAHGVHVVFLPDDAFEAFEAGHYSEGIVSIRAAALVAERAGEPWRLAAVLAHEAFHAVSIPDGAVDHGNTWWTEGSANFAERFVSGIEPWREPNCGGCPRIRTAQLERDDLVELYEEPPERPPWEREPGAETLDELGYAYGGFLVASYVERFGVEAYREAWRQFRSAAARDACACDDAHLTRLLVAASDGEADRASIHEPFRDLFETDRAAFDAAITGLVAEGDPLAEPVPLRWIGGELRYVPISAGMGWAPEIALDAAPRQERVDGAFTVSVAWWNATLASVPTGDSRPVVTLAFALDGAPAQPEVEADGSIALARLGPVGVGAHTVTARLVGPGNATYGPASEANVTVEVTARPRLALRSPPPGTQPPFLVGVAVHAADLGEPLADVPLRLLVSGEPVEEQRTDADGLAYFTLLEAPVGARVAVASEVEEIVVLERVLAPVAPSPNAPQPNAPQPNAPSPNAPSPNAPQPTAPQPAPVPFPAWCALLAAGVALALRRR